MTVQTIPVLDLQDFNCPPGATAPSDARSAAFVRALGESLSETGFFALVNHGIEPRLIDAAYGAAEAFFALPEATKLQYEVLELKGQRGFTRFGKEHAKDSIAPDLKEFWHVGRSHPAHHNIVTYPDNIWPREVPQFQPVMATLFHQLETCATQLMQACALFLQQSPNFFTHQVGEGGTILRVIHYPPMPQGTMPTGQRAAPHEDINLITLLCEATTPGLELLQANGDWLPIEPIPGQIIVDTGDMLQALSNGLLKSTTHRVVNPNRSRERRFSMPYFIHPRPDFDLTPLESCVTQTGGIPLFPCQTAGQYLTQRLQEIGLA